jgi:hypothetical protein
MVFVILYYLPRAILMLRAGSVALKAPPDHKRHKQAMAVLKAVCKGGGRFAWWRRPRP